MPRRENFCAPHSFVRSTRIVCTSSVPLVLQEQISRAVVIYHVYLSPRKSPCSLPFAFFNSARKITHPGAARHYTPSCFEGVGPLTKDVILQVERRVLISSFLHGDRYPHQCRNGSIYTGRGTRHQQCKGRSMGLRALKASRPTYGKFLGMEPTDV